MKLIVDIDEKVYRAIKAPLDCGGYYDSDCFNAIWKGTPIYDNSTNGDMIQAMFPNGDLHDYDYYDGYVIYEINYLDFRFNKDWWNAPYKAESEVAYDKRRNNTVEHGLP